MCAGLLEHDDSLSVSRSSRSAKGGFALLGQSPAGIYQCRNQKMDSLSETGNSQCLRARLLLVWCRPQLGDEDGDVSDSHQPGGSYPDSLRPDSLQAGTACPRAAQDWQIRAAVNTLRSF